MRLKPRSLLKNKIKIITKNCWEKSRLPTFALPYLSKIDCAKQIVCALSSTYWTSSTTHQEDSLADWLACCAHSKYRGLIVDNRNKRKHTVLVCACAFFSFCSKPIETTLLLLFSVNNMLMTNEDIQIVSQLDMKSFFLQPVEWYSLETI